MRSVSIRSLALVALFAHSLFATSAFAAAPVNTNFFGTAVEGYDVVAYFVDGKPAMGSSRFTHKWRGATWRFASAAHRDRFAADPSRYAPQYGGFCAYAVAHGATAGVDPRAWTIHEGRLYLNLDKGIQRRWSRDIPQLVARADANWPALSDD